MTAAVIPMLAPGAHYLAEDDAPLELSLDSRAAWSQWTDTWYFHYEIPHTGHLLTGLPAYAAALRAGYFRLVILSFADTVPADKAIRKDLDASGDYHLAARIPYVTTVFPHGSYRIWELDRGAG